MKLKWYHYSQNNSGGSFDYDENVSEHVLIQAPSVNSANSRAEDLGIYFDGVEAGQDCDCCGDRWHPCYSDSDGNDEPLIYGHSYLEVKPFGNQDTVRIHYHV